MIEKEEVNNKTCALCEWTCFVKVYKIYYKNYIIQNFGIVKCKVKKEK